MFVYKKLNCTKWWQIELIFRKEFLKYFYDGNFLTSKGHFDLFFIYSTRL